MRCPSCGHPNDHVVDSRSVHNGTAIRRRRECADCSHRFTTYERVDEVMPLIVKRDGRREPYSRDKLIRGLRVACRKRPVSSRDIDSLADKIESSLLSSGRREVLSAHIGDDVMQGLYTLDQVAYVRFASVYQSFEDTEAFARLLASMDHVRESNGKTDQEDSASKTAGE